MRILNQGSSDSTGFSPVFNAQVSDLIIAEIHSFLIIMLEVKDPTRTDCYIFLDFVLSGSENVWQGATIPDHVHSQ